jgi:hypothetical protein
MRQNALKLLSVEGFVSGYFVTSERRHFRAVTALKWIFEEKGEGGRPPPLFFLKNTQSDIAVMTHKITKISRANRHRHR